VTAVVQHPTPATEPGPSGSPGSRLLGLPMAVLGALMVVAGYSLIGSTWIAPDGLIGGGVALLVTAPFLRRSLDALVVTTPFMFYALAPVVGLLTVGSSDLVLPLVLAGLVVTTVLDPPPRGSLPTVTGAVPLLVAAALVVTASTAWWTILSDDFLFSRALSDGVKLGTGVAYFVVVVVLVRRGGREGAVRAMRLWAWVATSLAALSVVGATGVVEIIPSDGYRSLGFFQDPNLYAGYLLVSLSVLLFLSTVRPSALLPVQALVVVGGVVTTGSRGALASLALLAAFTAVMVNSARLRAMLLALTGVAVAAGYVVLQLRDTGQQVLGVDRLFDASTRVEQDPRLELWQKAVSLWMDSPVWGIGLGQFERFTVGIGGYRHGDVGHITHNSFLFVLVAFGAIGLVVFLWMFAWILRHLYRATGLSRNSRHALASGLLVIASQMMTLNLQNLRYVWVYFGLVLGLALLHRPEDEPAGWSVPPA
jgi:O-antigen ligase